MIPHDHVVLILEMVLALIQGDFDVRSSSFFLDICHYQLEL